MAIEIAPTPETFAYESTRNFPIQADSLNPV